MIRLPDLVRDSQLNTEFRDGCTIHKYVESSLASRQRTVLREETCKQERQVGGGGFGGAPTRVPGSVLTFSSINALFNTVLAPLTQNGIDMPPTKAEVDTWESGCKEFTATLNAWKTMLGVDLVGFNSLLTKNNLTPLKITPAALVLPASCTFVWPKTRTGGGK